MFKNTTKKVCVKSMLCFMAKVTFIWLITICTFTGVLFANTVKSQGLSNSRVSLSVAPNNLKNLLKEVEKRTDYTFSYSASVGSIATAGIEYREITLAKLLEILSNRYQLKFDVVGKMIAVSRRPPPAKPGRIAGKIIDEKGEFLPGANVKVIELNKAMQSSVDGSYEFTVLPGMYTLEVSYLSFQTIRIAGVVVNENQLTTLNIALKPSNNALQEVVITSSFKKESVAGLYAQQKNAASVTDGISAEQIARTPDNNVGAVLKRVSGLTVLDNKYVVVRGLTERYNQALIDGLTLPSTDLNRRNFSFDIVPTELVSSVVVNKTATPDVPAEFVGGQVMVNTLAIPNNNFLNISFGAGYNDRTTGKDFLSAGGRGKSDYFGFDDGRRKRPDNLVSWSLAQGQDDPRIEAINANGFKTGYAGAIEQSKRFNAESFKRYNYTAAPNQNYRMMLGRLYDLNQEKGVKLGFIAGLTYRNTQQANAFTSTRNLGLAGKDNFNDPDTAVRGNAYIFNTTLGGVLNAGLQTRKFKLSVKNIYTRIFNEDYYISRGADDINQLNEYNFADPVFTTILQHKVEGEHSIGTKGFKIDWSGGYSNLDQQHNDTRKFNYGLLNNTFNTYYQAPNVTTLAAVVGNYIWDYRMWTAIKEHDLNWALNLSYPFSFFKDKSLVKAGYTGWYKKRSQDLYFAKIYAKRNSTGFNDFNQFYETILSPEKVGYGLDQAYYFLDNDNGGLFNADSKYHAAYLMLDQHFFANKLRLVYGIRAENFNLANRQEKEIRRRQLFEEEHPDVTVSQEQPILTGEKNWNFLPSINAIFSLSEKTNMRAAYAKTMIRPDFRETATFAFPDPFLQASISGGNISSTKIQNVDLRFEYYPSPGEILSVSGFYKYLDRPVELVNLSPGASIITLTYQNQHSAKNTGIEMEFRKSLDIISPSLANVTVFGNAAYIWSEIKTISKIANPAYADDPENQPEKIEVVQDFKRLLIGQSPYILNAGLAYQSKYAGATMSFNRSGYRSYVISLDPAATEFQRARTLIDLQLSGRLLKQKAEIKLNVANVLNTRDEFYMNYGSWAGGYAEGFTRTKGTDNYNAKDGDRLRYNTTYGRTYNLVFIYNF